MTAAPLTIGVVAGEASGDQLGAHLIKALRQQLPQARFTGIGGARMQAEGMESLFPLEKLAVRGYVEVLRHYFEIVGIRRRLTAHFLKERPALFVGVDAPDFNLGLEAKLKAAGIPTIHYVSPQLWAWRGHRIHSIKRAVDRMLVVFPFEQEVYERAGVPVTYVGHPLAEILQPTPDRRPMREQLRLPAAARVIALLPGSRDAEVEHLAGLFIDTASRIAAAAPETHFLVPLVSRRTRELFEAALYSRPAQELNLTVLFGHAHDAMEAADVVLAASGTATLEAALIGRPVVIAYRMPRVSWWLLKGRHYQPYVGLPNVVAGEFVVPEFLQDEATPENLSQAVLNLLFDNTVRARLEARFTAMADALRQDSRSRIASALVPMLRPAT
ncbi:MAG TPA: lipid-A-disaccharide synthase [Burkholderiales bacterium]|nr:lipid-A-disaccharide synthase [Burkholderiales bacterium]